MKYQVYVSGAAKSRAEAERTEPEAGRRGYARDGGDGHTHEGAQSNSGGDGAAFAGHSGRPIVRRFPPVIQFLTDVDPYVQQQLQTLCMRAHRQGKNIQAVCEELYVYARSIGYVLSLGVQEVFSSQMPSFPGQTVQSALLLADVKRLSSPNGYHEGRVAV